jgi:hypothetical protein
VCPNLLARLFWNKSSSCLRFLRVAEFIVKAVLEDESVECGRALPKHEAVIH